MDETPFFESESRGQELVYHRLVNTKGHLEDECA